MKFIPLILALVIPAMLASCVEPLPLKVGVCKEDLCLHVETTIPARPAGKAVKEVQPVQP